MCAHCVCIGVIILYLVLLAINTNRYNTNTVPISESNGKTVKLSYWCGNQVEVDDCAQLLRKCNANDKAEYVAKLRRRKYDESMAKPVGSSLPVLPTVEVPELQGENVCARTNANHSLTTSVHAATAADEIHCSSSTDMAVTINTSETSNAVVETKAGAGLAAETDFNSDIVSESIVPNSPQTETVGEEVVADAVNSKSVIPHSKPDCISNHNNASNIPKGKLPEIPYGFDGIPVGQLFGCGLGFGLKALFENGEPDGSSGRADGVAVYLKRAATLILSRVVGNKVFGDDTVYTWEQRNAKMAAITAAIASSSASSPAPPKSPVRNSGNYVGKKDKVNDRRTIAPNAKKASTGSSIAANPNLCASPSAGSKRSVDSCSEQESVLVLDEETLQKSIKRLNLGIGARFRSSSGGTNRGTSSSDDEAVPVVLDNQQLAESVSRLSKPNPNQVVNSGCTSNEVSGKKVYMEPKDLEQSINRLSNIPKRYQQAHPRNPPLGAVGSSSANKRRLIKQKSVKSGSSGISAVCDPTNRNENSGQGPGENDPLNESASLFPDVPGGVQSALVQRENIFDLRNKKLSAPKNCACAGSVFPLQSGSAALPRPLASTSLQLDLMNSSGGGSGLGGPSIVGLGGTGLGLSTGKSIKGKPPLLSPKVSRLTLNHSIQTLNLSIGSMSKIK